MNTRRAQGATLLLVLILLLSWVAVGVTSAAGTNNLITVYISSAEPATLDPALASDSTSAFLIHQMFAGLTRIHETTGEVLPDLAESWTASVDATVFEFTLRDGLTWSDGTPLVAGHVRDGVLRSLRPAVDSGFSYLLFVIQNAEDYKNGDITDPNLVGITVLDDRHIRFDLEYSVGHFPNLMANWVAKPVPLWVIDAWGEAWTDPAHILTSGPYHLAERVPDEHMLLVKRPGFHDAANVQIDQVDVVILDGMEAWQRYMEGFLDTVAVPVDYQTVLSDPILSAQLHQVPDGCTYYYGFSISQPPFDDVRVRKAFAAALDRQGLIDDVLRGPQQPALTFTSPGMFGHVDGQAAGVGVPYDPVQARQWLSDAGYPNGTGLPPITLWFNSNPGHQAIAEYVQQGWADELNVDVALQDMEWSSYLGELNNGEFQVWRLGWCYDYADAYNFLHDAPNPDRHGGWVNPTYDDLMNQAAVTTDPSTRADIFYQAEEILVETDAVMIPMYYYASAAVTRPYLQRDHGLPAWNYVAGWRIEHADSTTVEPAVATTFEPEVDKVTYQFAAGTFAAPVTVTHSIEPMATVPDTGDLLSVGGAYSLEAVDSATQQPVTPGQPYGVTIPYSELERTRVNESTLALYAWQEGQWVREPTSVVDTIGNTVSASPDHFSLWVVMGRPHRIHMPMMQRVR